MRTYRVWAAIGLWALLSGPAWAKSMSYDQTIQSGSDTYTAKTMWRDGWFRIEAVVDGQRTISFRNAEGMFSYLPEEGMAMRLPNPPPGQQVTEHLNDYNGYLTGHQATKLRTETIKGYECDVYRLQDPETGETTVWVWRDRMFPVRMESHKDNESFVVEFDNIQFDVAMADALFQLPPGVDVMDVGAMMQGFEED